MVENLKAWAEIGGRMAQVRKSCRMKQIQAAAALGIKQSNLSALENGKAKLSLEVLLQACELYGTHSDYILFGREVKATNDYMDELQTLAVRYADILFKLDMLENQKDVDEIRQHIDGLLMP